MKHVQHFVFAYGSLICSHSRSLTVPEHSVATPVVAHGLERIWAKRSSVRGMTAMGVRFRPKASCLGVLLAVDSSAIARFDEREVGYSRYPLHLDKVHTLDFLDYNSDSNNPHHHHHRTSFCSIKEGNRHDRIRIWVYVQEQSLPPTQDHPIVQSYVDTILRGCLSIHPEFAKDFLASTKGWSLADFHDDDDDEDNDDDDDVYADDDSSDSAQSSSSNISTSSESDHSRTSSSSHHLGTSSSSSMLSPWVDDRHDPIYTRGDPVWSLQYSRQLDALIQHHQPLHFQKRLGLPHRQQKQQKQPPPRE